MLRRLRDSAGEIRGAEWLLLGIETFAIVAGILIAFELEQWASNRRERAQPIALAFSQGECPAELGDIEAVDARISDRPSEAALVELTSVIGLSVIPDEDLKQALSSYNYATNLFHSSLDEMRALQTPVLSPDDPRISRSVDPDVAARDPVPQHR